MNTVQQEMSERVWCGCKLFFKLAVGASGLATLLNSILRAMTEQIGERSEVPMVTGTAFSGL
jgi:hypothetical protein